VVDRKNKQRFASRVEVFQLPIRRFMSTGCRFFAIRSTPISLSTLKRKDSTTELRGNASFFNSRLYSFALSLTGRMNATASFRLPGNLISNKPDCHPPYHCRLATVKIFVATACFQNPICRFAKVGTARRIVRISTDGGFGETALPLAAHAKNIIEVTYETNMI
jgi:hypothetical protein